MLFLLSPAGNPAGLQRPCRRAWRAASYSTWARRKPHRSEPKNRPGHRRLMSISDALAQLNVAVHATWCPPFTPANARQAVLALQR